LGRNKAYHDSARAGRPGVTYPACLAADETFQVPDKFIMVLDMDAGTMAFIVEGNYLGVAHTGLKGRKLHIIVSAVWGHCEITMRYLAGLEPGPLSLLSMARLRIRQALVAAASTSRDSSEADEADVNNSRSQQRRVSNSSNTGVMAAADPTRIDRLVLPRSMKFYLKHQDSFTSSSVDTNAVSDASSKCCAWCVNIIAALVVSNGVSNWRSREHNADLIVTERVASSVMIWEILQLHSE